MKQFKTDQLTNEREIQVAAIKKVVPNFNEEGKSDTYINAYFDAMVGQVEAQAEEPDTEEVAATENKKQQEEESFYEDSADEIAQKKHARLNMRGVGEQQRKSQLGEDSADEIEKNKHTRLNMRGK